MGKKWTVFLVNQNCVCGCPPIFGQRKFFLYWDTSILDPVTTTITVQHLKNFLPTSGKKNNSKQY